MITRKWRRLSFSDIGEDQADIFFHRIARNADFFRERLIFGRLFDTLPRAIVFPAMIETADTFAFDRTDRKLRATVRATRPHQVRNAAVAAIDREVFT